MTLRYDGELLREMMESMRQARAPWVSDTMSDRQSGEMAGRYGIYSTVMDCSNVALGDA